MTYVRDNTLPALLTPTLCNNDDDDDDNNNNNFLVTITLFFR